MKQQEALNLLKMGKNIFLTGAAGSGKTYLLNQYIRYLKDNNVNVAVTASTGIAATHLQGSTIHSWSGIGVRNSLTDDDLETILKSDHIKRNYRKTKVLIIDEISMLHKFQLDMVDTIARHILVSARPFGGMQVVLCGDFFQLPPVASSYMPEEKQFAFEGDAWKNGDFHVCYLEEQHRQNNDPLLTILNDIRSGTAGEHTKVPLRTRYKKEPEGNIKATKLYSRNINVDAINEKALASIPGQEKIFAMATKGFHGLVDGLKKSCLAVEQLKLKIGAEVMFIKNDLLGNYVNGTRAIVVDFEKSTAGCPIVKTYDNRIITAYYEEWKLEENGILRAVITQIPLRLAWAITIHKSQGMTLDAAEIDLGDAFEPGMGYVALSRVRSLAGLKLMNLNEMALRVHPKILQYDAVLKENSAINVSSLQALSAEDLLQCQQKTLFERFEGNANPTPAKKKSKAKPKKAKRIPTHMTTLQMLMDNMLVDEIAAKRELSVATIISHVEKLKGLQLLDDGCMSRLKESLSQSDFDAIFAELKQSADGLLTPVYDKFEGRYSFANIRMVRLFV